MSLARQLRDGLGGRIGVAVTPVTDAPSLWPGEAEAVARAVPARRQEFAAGRGCIRAAMAELGLPQHPIYMGPDRAPQWPLGLTGSLAHGAGQCVALVARQADSAGLGVDIEPDVPLPPDVGAEVLNDAEAALPEADHRVVFCAKEAVYKAYYREFRTVWGFDAVAIRLLDMGRFEARLTAYPDRAPVQGLILRAAGVIVTALALPHRK